MAVTISGSTGIAGVDGSASTPAVQGTDTNTGIYYPAADQVAVAASGSQVLLATTSGLTVTGASSVSGNLSFNSGYGSAATAYGCRAWVNFNGTGTVAIRASGNVSSITDNGVGDYTVNFTNAMPDANYCITCSSGNGANVGLAIMGPRIADPTTSAVRLPTINDAGVLQDNAFNSVAIFR